MTSTKSLPVACALLLAAAACQKGATGNSAQDGGATQAPAATAAPAPPPAAPLTEEQKNQALYGLGQVLGERLKSLELKPRELDVLLEGLTDEVMGKKLKADPAEYQEKISALAKKRQSAAADKVKAESKAFVDKAAKEPGAKKFPSGLVYKVLKKAQGPQPVATDKVKVNYEGKLTNGTVFDSSYTRNEPISFPLNGVIKCWTEGVQKMHVGETAQLICPSDIAYGDMGHPPTIPGGSTLVFKVELLGIEKPPQAAPPQQPPAQTAPQQQQPAQAAPQSK